MNCLIETALLTHGLRSIANEELAQSWHCPDAILAWVDRGELKLGPIGEYLPFRERSEELVRIDCDHLEEARQSRASGALTASGTMAVCRRLDIPMAITCGMGGIGDLRGEELCPDLPALMNIPVALISTSPKDMLDRPATLDWLRRHGVHTAGEPCTGYLFCGEPVALELPLSSCNNEAAVRRLTANGGLLLLNPIPEKERVQDRSILVDAIKAGKQAEAGCQRRDRPENRGLFLPHPAGKYPAELPSGQIYNGLSRRSQRKNAHPLGQYPLRVWFLFLGKCFT